MPSEKEVKWYACPIPPTNQNRIVRFQSRVISGWQSSEVHMNVPRSLSFAASHECMTPVFNCKHYMLLFSCQEPCLAHRMGSSSILLSLCTGIQALFPPVHGPAAQLWSRPAICIRPCCKMGLMLLPQRGWGLALPQPYAEMVPTEWVTRRSRGRRACYTFC